MKERLITLLGAVLAFYILFRLLFPSITLQSETLSSPTSDDRGKYGLAGLYQWLEKTKVPTLSLRERYDTLSEHPQLAARDNLLVITLPYQLNPQAHELEKLKTWVARGNHVLLLIAMSDWPKWADRDMESSITELLDSFGLQLAEADNEADMSDTRPDADASRDDTVSADLAQLRHPSSESRKLVPAAHHPLLDEVQQVQATWLSSEGLHWHLQGSQQARSALVLLRDELSQTPALWLGFHAKGNVLITRHSDLFANASLGLADNAKLFRNIAQHFVGAQGKVIFDDMHQGLSTIYDPEAFFRDPRLHHTLWFLLALWILYVLGHSNRFGQLRQDKPSRQIRDHVQAIGDLFARRLHSSAAALRYAQHFFNEVRAIHGLPLNGQPVWEQLGQHPAISPVLLQRARLLHQRALQQKRVNLIRFVNTLITMRKELQ